MSAITADELQWSLVTMNSKLRADVGIMGDVLMQVAAVIAAVSRFHLWTWKELHHFADSAGQAYLWLWRVLILTIRREDPIWIEMLTAAIEASFLVWLATSVSFRHPMRALLLQMAPLGIYLVVCLALIFAHIFSIALRRYDYRAYALTASFLGWAWLAASFARFGLNFVHVPSVPISLFCLAAVFSLVYRHGRTNGRIE